jgi:GNAT superfamily N-acetyltransferase
MFDIRGIATGDREMVNRFLREQWGATMMILRGERVELDGAPGFIAWEDGGFAGLITYKIDAGECEILSLDSLRERQGIGTALMDKVISLARAAGCKKLKLITTNDNINALRFYQKRGFDMAALHRNAMEVSRSMKPSIPMIGTDGIPLRHEIEFELVLDVQTPSQP